MFSPQYLVLNHNECSLNSSCFMQLVWLTACAKGFALPVSSMLLQKSCTLNTYSMLNLNLFFRSGVCQFKSVEKGIGSIHLSHFFIPGCVVVAVSLKVCCCEPTRLSELSRQNTPMVGNSIQFSTFC